MLAGTGSGRTESAEQPNVLTAAPTMLFVGGAPKSPGHAFLSYVREDSLAVDRIQRVLEAAGVRVWRDTADLWPGEDWRARIREAITGDALAFIVCFSRNSIGRERSFQNEELALAVEQLRQRRPGAPWLMPVRLDDCVIPDLDIGGGRTLASIQRADVFGHRYDEGIARLVAAVLRILGGRRDAVAAASRPGRETGRGTDVGRASLPLPYDTARRSAELPDVSRFPAAGQRSVSAAFASDDLIVSPEGHAQYKTISSAVSDARPRATIVVRPGVYRESLRLEMPVSIIGDGQRDEIILASPAGSCITASGGGIVRGLSLRGDGENAMIHVQGGRMEIVDCEIAGPSSAGVLLEGGGLKIAKCHVHGMRHHDQKAISAEGGDAEISECDLTDSYFGVNVIQRAHCELRSCQILRNEFGAYVDKDGTMELVDCTVMENKFPVLAGNGYAVVRGCTISRNHQYAVHMASGSRGVIENNDLSGNPLGIWSEAPKPYVTISGNKGDALHN